MTPIGNPQTPAEELYNAVHIQTRNPVERCIGVLKSRFRCLAITGAGAVIYSPNRVCALVSGCCVLHNICVQRGEVVDVDNDILEPAGDNAANQNGVVNGFEARARLIRNIFNR